jgi:hypothetical protein
MLIQQIYPQNPKLRAEIPLWLKFRCFAYQGFIGRQSGNFDGVLPTPPNQLATLYVPAPQELVSGTQNNYKNIGAQQIFNAVITPASAMAGMAAGMIPAVGEKMQESMQNAPKLIQAAIEALLMTSSYFFGISPPDFEDNIFAGTGKRTYTFNLVFPCLTSEDSFAAFAIGRSFEALSAPYASRIPFIFNHPPMWLFGVGPGVGPAIDFTWLTDPQLSVLTNVAVNRSAPDKGSYAVLTDYGLKPSVTTISLKFVEIEPVYRDSLSLISRSQALQNASSGISQLFTI